MTSVSEMCMVLPAEVWHASNCLVVFGTHNQRFARKIKSHPAPVSSHHSPVYWVLFFLNTLYFIAGCSGRRGRRPRVEHYGLWVWGRSEPPSGVRGEAPKALAMSSSRSKTVDETITRQRREIVFALLVEGWIT